MSMLSTGQALKFLQAPKRFENASHYAFPVERKVSRRLIAADVREVFVLDVRRRAIEFGKYTFQNRVRTTIALARLDIGGARHRNPDGEYVDCPHLHIYREGYGDKWAYALPQAFAGCTSPEDYFFAFLDWCNVEKPSF